MSLSIQRSCCRRCEGCWDSLHRMIHQHYVRGELYTKYLHVRAASGGHGCRCPYRGAAAEGARDVGLASMVVAIVCSARPWL